MLGRGKRKMGEEEEFAEKGYKKYAQNMVHLDITEDNEWQIVLINQNISTGIELKTKDKEFLRLLRRTITVALGEDQTDIERSYI